MPVERSDFDHSAREPPHGGQKTLSHQRSKHVMWIGNVPKDATEEELTSFLAQMPLEYSERKTPRNAIVSISLLTKSRCAFVNYATDSLLCRALRFFSGMRLRPQEPRGPPLLCRPGNKQEASQADVPRRKNKGLHRAYFRESQRSCKTGLTRIEIEQKHHKDRGFEGSEGENCVENEVTGARLRPWRGTLQSLRWTTPSPYRSTDPPYALSPSDHDGSSQGEASSASTDSSLLAKPIFAERFFILKARTLYDIEKGIQTGSWTVRARNWDVLAQALRNSRTVFLLFSANGSGLFSGYAKLLRPFEEIFTDWHTAGARSSQRDLPSLRTMKMKDSWSQDRSKDSAQVQKRPVRRGLSAASSENMSGSICASSARVTTRKKHNAATSTRNSDTEDLSSHKRASRIKSVGLQRPSLLARQDAVFQDPLKPPSAPRLHRPQPLSHHKMVQSVAISGNKDPSEDDDALSHLFERKSQPSQSSLEDTRVFVQWLQTEPLPFWAVKHFRNPWNGNRSLRVARDGTEIAVDVGIELLSFWDKHAASTREKRGLSSGNKY